MGSSDLTTVILVPTLNRAHHLPGFIDAVEANTTDVPHQAVFLTDRDDDATLQVLVDRNLDYFSFERRPDGEPQTMVHKMNEGYRRTDEPFLIGLSDDTRVLPGWLSTAHKAMAADGVHMVCLNDQVLGHVHDGELTGHVLVRRSYIDEHSGVIDQPRMLMHEGYWHFFSDMELWQTGRARGVYVSCWEAKIDHPHPNDGTAPVDGVHEWAREHARQDRMTFESRRHLWEGATAHAG